MLLDIWIPWQYAMFPRAMIESEGCYVLEIFSESQKNYQKLIFSTLNDSFLGKSASLYSMV